MVRLCVQHRMTRHTMLRLAAVASAVLLVSLGSSSAQAADCSLDDCPNAGLSNGAANIQLTHEQAPSIVGASPVDAVDYLYRVRTQCDVAADATGNCSPGTL